MRCIGSFLCVTPSVTCGDTSLGEGGKSRVLYSISKMSAALVSGLTLGITAWI